MEVLSCKKRDGSGFFCVYWFGPNTQFGRGATARTKGLIPTCKSGSITIWSTALVSIRTLIRGKATPKPTPPPTDRPIAGTKNSTTWRAFKRNTSAVIWVQEKTAAKAVGVVTTALAANWGWSTTKSNAPMPTGLVVRPHGERVASFLV